MEHYLMRQLQFARQNTMKLVKDVDDIKSENFIKGFNNHIKWNLGHIYVVHERFAFHFVGEELMLPEAYLPLFSPGTKPLEVNEPMPSMEELTNALNTQITRIERRLSNRLKEQVTTPYTTSTGLCLQSVEEFLSFCLYHEGMHFATIKAMKQLLS